MIARVDSRQRHRCTICGIEGAWSDAWQWFGSYKDQDEGKPVLKTCSAACRKGMSASALASLGRRLRQDPDLVLRPTAVETAADA